MENLTLGNIFGRSSSSHSFNTTTQDTSSYFDCYLKVFTYLVNQRFQGLDNWQQIDKNTIDNLAQFSAILTPQIMENWESVYSQIQVNFGRTRSSKAA